METMVKLKLTDFIRRGAGSRIAATDPWSRRAVCALLVCCSAAVLAPARLFAADAPLKIGVIGAGQIGGPLARLWVQAGHPVMIASRHPEQLQPMAKELGPLAQVGTPQQAAKFADVVFMAVPFQAVDSVIAEIGNEVRGKVVLDPSNPFPPGSDLQKSVTAQGGAAVVHAKKLAGARMVRAFNTVGHAALPKVAHRSGELVGVPIAGDDPKAIAVAEQLIRDAGFEPVLVGPLSSASRFDIGVGELPRGEFTASELRQKLGLAKH